MHEVLHFSTLSFLFFVLYKLEMFSTLYTLKNNHPLLWKRLHPWHMHLTRFLPFTDWSDVRLFYSPKRFPSFTCLHTTRSFPSQQTENFSLFTNWKRFSSGCVLGARWKSLGWVHYYIPLHKTRLGVKERSPTYERKWTESGQVCHMRPPVPDVWWTPKSLFSFSPYEFYGWTISRCIGQYYLISMGLHSIIRIIRFLATVNRSTWQQRHLCVKWPRWYIITTHLKLPALIAGKLVPDHQSQNNQ